MIRRDSDPAYVKACLIEYLRPRLEDEFSATFFHGIDQGQLTVTDEAAYELTPRTVTLRFYIPVSNYLEGEVNWFAKMIADGYRLMHEEDGPLFAVQVAFGALPTVVPATESGLNNCSFKTENTIAHDELRFRSNSEVSIYKELRDRTVLFFPNPAAVLGREFPEEPEKREPDFLICHRGKWGILEVSGEPWHSGAISTAKDHDRARLFQRYGLVCVQHFDANRCRHSPADVVDEFLALLAQS